MVSSDSISCDSKLIVFSTKAFWERIILDTLMILYILS